MTVKGRIECRIQPTGYASGDFFVTLHNFLLNLPNCTRIACNFGSGGTGFDYADTNSGKVLGTNAFYVFRFSSALIPFYVLVQMVTYNATGAAPGALAIASPGNLSNTLGAASNVGVCISIAQLLSGGSPWAGGTANAGADAKGVAVWTAGASTLISYPRVNSVGGTYATNCEGMMILNMMNVSASEALPDLYINNGGSRIHLLADNENLMVLSDTGNNGSYSVFYFGRYQPRAGVGLTVQVPYFCCNNTNSGLDPIIPNSTVFGYTTQQTSTSLVDGGVPHPTVSNGVKVMTLDYSTLFNNFLLSPNKIISSPPRFDMQPVYIAMSEAPYNALLGTSSFFRVGYGMPPNWTSPDKKLAAFGNGLVSSAKIIVPWDGVTAIGSGNTRQGISF